MQQEEHERTYSVWQMRHKKVEQETQEHVRRKARDVKEHTRHETREAREHVIDTKHETFEALENIRYKVRRQKSTWSGMRARTAQGTRDTRPSGVRENV